MTYPLDEFQTEIKTELKHALSTLKLQCEIQLECPPEGMGDYAFPCFQLAAIAKQSPQHIAQDIEQKIKPGKWIAEVKAQAGYVNFFVNATSLTASTLTSIQKLHRIGAKKDTKEAFKYVY